METTLKQRLIGAAVLIALAVIFVPMILDGSGQRDSVTLNMEVPPEPEFTFESELPDPEKLDDAPAIVQKKQRGDDKPKVDETEGAKVKAASVPVPKVVEATEDHIKKNPSLNAWAVQVAAFGEHDKALALEKKLIAANYSAFTEESKSGSKILYRVKVGPELKRENAEKLKNKIEKEQGLSDSFVINHP